MGSAVRRGPALRLLHFTLLGCETCLKAGLTHFRGGGSRPAQFPRSSAAYERKKRRLRALDASKKTPLSAYS